MNRTTAREEKIDSLPLLNRDVSWLYFNHRILQEARREEKPLLERLKFLGIYSSNLDEFFRVRMATQARLAEMKGKHLAAAAAGARTLFRDLTTIDTAYAREYGRAVSELTAELARNGIRILNEKELDENQAHFVRCHFRREVSGFVSPVWLSHLGAFTQESDSHIYMAVEMSGPDLPSDYALIELPDAKCGRFIRLPDAADGAECWMYLDDLVRHTLPMIFTGMGYDTFAAYSFKFTKDAGMELDNDMHASMLQKIAKGVKSRRKGAALRLLHDVSMPAPLLQAIMKKMKPDALDTVQPSGRYQNHKSFISFPATGKPGMRFQPWPQVVPPELKQPGSLIRLIRARDRFVHVPYQTFDYVVRLLQEAAVSKDVKSIRITLYRVAHDSKIIEALICAARNGKKVTAVVELLARFDESSNIDVSKRMQEAGINVVFGVEGLKVHSKIIHIGMKRGRDVALIGTGNFHEGNARTYTDYFMMTARPSIVSDVAAVFDFIRRPYIQPTFKRLLVSPLVMRERFCSLIDAEIANARAGREAFIKIKINHITDTHMCRKLYEAAAAGVKVDLLVRGNCSLYTGLPALRGNLNASGIIDRYLEHARIFIFHADGADLTFLGSADWMPRNLDNRVEVVAPVGDPDIKADCMYTVDVGLADNVQARVVDGTGLNLIRSNGLPPRRSQEEIYRHYACASAGAGKPSSDKTTGGE